MTLSRSVHAGDLRDRVTIEQFTEEQDSVGQDVRTWSTFASSIPAFIEPLGGNELFTAQSVMPNASTRITMRFLKGVTEKMRVLFQGTYFNIINVANNDSRNRWLVLTCSSGLTDEA